jgi:hypothetical protein
MAEDVDAKEGNSVVKIMYEHLRHGEYKMNTNNCSGGVFSPKIL